MKRFSYADFEMNFKEPEIIEEHLLSFMPYFSHCRHVVDIGSASGIFLKLLRNAKIKATGIENNPDLVEHLRSQQFDVIDADATSIWPNIQFEFDGIFCSHLIEHLEFEKVVDLIEGFSSKIKNSGIVILAFPNPESLEAQLFQFWRDPQHVRFYHSDLICGILKHYGFEIEKVFSQGTWGQLQETNVKDNIFSFRRIFLVRWIGRILKFLLGIRKNEIEADYILKLRRIGREVVIVARKINKVNDK
ncbi:MAG: class I SAM-dependent methyltransferase [Candidatus Omnitrophica bacterium]|nr:class I SAM-dependent methyltransferase [Candidatus Omnitrophota bacterium]